jgi:hypothetical protein
MGLIILLVLQLAFPVVIALAALKGDRPEQQGAAALLVCWVATLVFQDDSRRFGPYITVALMTAIDFALLAAFVLIALRSRRAWPVWAAGFQAISLFPDVTRLLQLKLSGIIFVTAVDIANYGLLVALAAGAIIAWRERETLKAMAETLKEPQFRF